MRYTCTVHDQACVNKKAWLHFLKQVHQKSYIFKMY